MEAGKIKKCGRIFLILTLSMLVLIALSAQVCFAYLYTVDLSVTPGIVYVNSSINAHIHAYDADHWTDASGASVMLTVTGPSGRVSLIPLTTNSQGVIDYSYKLILPGAFSFRASSTYNYTKAGWVPVGDQSGTSQTVTVSVNPTPTPAPTSPPTAAPTVAPTMVPTAVPTAAPTVAPTVTQPSPTTSAGTSTDNTAPVTTLNFTGVTNSNGEYMSNVICTLTVSDVGGSGVNLTQYSLDGNTWNNYTDPFTINKPGMSTVYYKSFDNAGNAEIAQVKSLIIAGATSSASPSPKTPAPSMLAALMSLIAAATILLVMRKSVRK